MSSLAVSAAQENSSSAQTMPELLERGGFRLRGRNRATCVYCSGRDRSTVAYTDEVAYCHRCGWRANIITLARELGIPVAPETAQHREARARAAEFEQWRGACQRILTDWHRELFRDAVDALARFYHNQAELSAALDILSFEKCSFWLEAPMRREALSAAFEDACARSDGGHCDVRR